MAVNSVSLHRRSDNRRVVISANTSWQIVVFRSNLVRRLLAEGYAVTVISPNDGYEAKVRELGCSHVAVHMDNKGVSPIQDFFLFLRYYSALRRIRPAHFLGFTVKPNVYGTMAARAVGAQVINNISGLGTAFIRRTWITPVVSALYRGALSLSSIIYFQNADDRADFIKKNLVDARRTELLPGSGVDLERFQFSQLPLHGPLTFLFVGRVLRDKGVTEYVEASRILRARGISARFQILGFLDVANNSAISKTEMDAWVLDGMEYLGPSDDVRPFISRAHCVVLPSYREGTPRVLLEAAASGRPLVATNVPGCRDVIEEGVNGFLCAAQDAGDLADAMERIINLPREELAGMGAAGRKKVEIQYDETIVLDRYVAAVAKLQRTEI